jgi:hypothetical protein
MKRLLIIFAGLLAIPALALAAPVSWDFANGILQPLQSGWSAQVRANNFVATSTTATSTFAVASTTKLCIGSDCRFSWPTGGDGFSTTSANYWASAGLGISTTSLDYWKGARDFFSTTSAQYFVHSSTTIPKTYTANTWTALQTFASSIFTNATSTNFDITGLFTFGGVTGSTWASFCTAITGGAGLCDGTDADTSGTWKSVTPTGTINGSNTGFTLPDTPDTDSLVLSLNGAYQTLTEDYSLSGGSITFTVAPPSGSVLHAKYTVGGVSGGPGGFGIGTWSTTTSSVSGYLVNYANNASDIAAIGSNSTTTAEHWFDPNALWAKISGRLDRDGETRLDGTPNSDHSAVGPTTNTFNAGESITEVFSVFMHTDGKWYRTDADSTASSTSMLGVHLYNGSTVAANSPLLVALPGSFVRDDSFNWTPGDTIYLSVTSGAWASSTPTGTDDVVRVVGHAVTADVVFFNPSPDYITLE